MVKFIIQSATQLKKTATLQVPLVNKIRAIVEMDGKVLSNMSYSRGEFLEKIEEVKSVYGFVSIANKYNEPISLIDERENKLLIERFGYFKWPFLKVDTEIKPVYNWQKEDFKDDLGQSHPKQRSYIHKNKK